MVEVEGGQMTEQEEINERIAQWLYIRFRERFEPVYWTFNWDKVSEEEKEKYRTHARDFAIYLHSQGVVIKVEGELPKIPFPLDWVKMNNEEIGYDTKERVIYKKAQQDMLKAGYVKTKPLVE